MAIVTDRTITIHGVDVGVSKPIQTLIANGDFTYAELSKYAFVGRYDFVNDSCAVYDNDNNEYGQSAQLLTLDKYPILNDPSKSWDTIWYQYHGSVGRTAATYGKMILLYDFNDARNSIKKDFTDNNTACVVTELNPRLLKMSPNVSLSTITASLGEPGTYTVYDVETSVNISWFDDDSASPFRPLCVSEIEGHGYFFFPLYNNTLHARQNIAGNTDGTYAQLVDLQDSFDNEGDAYLSPWASSSSILDFCPGHDYGTTFIGAYTLNTSRADRLLILDYHGAWDFNGNLQVKASSLDAALKQCAACGLYFEVNGITYKPLSSGGIVTGYTTDLDKNGEWDLINDVTGNTIPDTPGGGGGGGDGDDMDSMTTGFASSLNGCAKYYLMSPSDMRDLITDFYTHAFAGSTMSESIMSCHLCGIEPSFFLATSNEKIKIPTVSQQNIFESVNSYAEITAVNNLIPAGHIDVPRLNNDFHDFTPYSIYEIFIPYCGWCSLPDTVAGRTIWVEYHVDIRTMSGKGIVLVQGDNGGKATCAEMAMNFGVTSPFAVIEAGLARQAAVTAGIQTAVGFASGVVGAMSGHNALTVSGVGNAIQGCANGAMSSMTNYTQVQGKAGDTSDFANGRQCYLKISWSKTDEVVKNSMFGHTIGYLCNEVGKLEGYSGFTVCLNPHITGIDCTDEEKEEIKNLLENGVIL